MSDEERKILQLIRESKDPGIAAEIAIGIIIDEIKRTDCRASLAMTGDADCHGAMPLAMTSGRAAGALRFATARRA